MNTAAPKSLGLTLSTLWCRAPLWRLSLLTALLFTGAVVLFPPQTKVGDTDLKTFEDAHASYTPPSDPAKKEPPKPKVTMAAPMPAPAPPVSAAPKKPIAAPQTAAPQAAAPQAAALSMATAGAPQKQNDSGVDEALMGRLYRGSFKAYGFDFPLPPGDWALLANSTLRQPNGAGMLYFIGQIKNKRITQMIQVASLRSTDTPSNGFPEFKSCTTSSVFKHFAYNDDSAPPFIHQACWTLYNGTTLRWPQWGDKTKPLNNIERAVAGDLSAKGVSYPQDFIVVGFHQAEKWGMLEATYFFSPEAEGLSSHTVLSAQETDWSPANVGQYPEKTAYITKLKSWAATNWPQFKEVFAKGENAIVPQLVFNTPAQPPAPPTSPQPSAAPAPAPNGAEVQRGAKSGIKQQIWHALNINPDCSSAGYPTVTVLNPPPHGQITAEQGTDFPNFGKENPRSACNMQRVPSVNIYYTSNDNYLGQDTASISILSVGGNLARVNFTITVQ